jgi:DNA-binding NarL/FixJ family response regulator
MSPLSITDDYIVKAIKAGANGYLLKDIPKTIWRKAIRLAYRGCYRSFF